MNIHWRSVLIATIAAGVIRAQEPPTFDVASIKLSTPPTQGPVMTGIRGGPGSSDPQHAIFTRMRLAGFISFAYDLKPYQYNRMDARLQEKDFDISVSIPEGATRDQFRAMMRSLLTERFHLMLHWEKKTTDVYDLVQGKGGHKLKPPTTPGESKIPAGGFEKDEQNLPKVPPGVTTQVCAFAGCRLQEIGQTLARLLVILSADLNAPVIDATGLAGQKFDFLIGYGDSAPTARSVDAPPPLPTAITDQLGLRLEKRKGEVDFLVVDSLDRQPTEN